MDVQNEVEKKMTIETKLLAGFLLVYIASAAVPGSVTFLIDRYVQDGLISDALIGLITFCVLLIAVSIISHYLMKWVTRPVRKLSQAAKNLVLGNLDVNLEVEGSSELKTITQSLLRLKSSLKIAFDWLGPPELEKSIEKTEMSGIGLNEKVIFGMVVFLIFNPLATLLSHMIFSDSVLLSSMISIIFSIILLTLIANYLYQEIIKPLAHLANMADRVSKGDYSLIDKIKYTGDIGRLENDFILISERVQRAMKELDMNG